MKKHMKKILKEEKERKPAGKGESALVSNKLNNAGRPMRRAAAGASKAWISPIDINDIDVDFVKPPWRPVDQDEEDIGTCTFIPRTPT